ncbi:hypothetical protein QL285_063992 [Trifolium repens]|nr:hypothetical protein QL285_063992 [Trifolium repens]
MATIGPKGKVQRLNPSHPSLQKISRYFLPRATSRLKALARRDEQNSPEQKTYRKNVYRFSIPKLIAETFSATEISSTPWKIILRIYPNSRRYIKLPPEILLN